MTALIRESDFSWPFEIPPTPRNLGSLIEILRCCIFLRNTSTGEIRPWRDIDHARNLGAYDTPDPVVRLITSNVVNEISKSGTFPKIVEPSCGAGYFLIDALDRLIENFPNEKPEDMIIHCLLGIDIDPVGW